MIIEDLASNTWAVDEFLVVCCLLEVVLYKMFFGDFVSVTRIRDEK